MKDIGIIDYGVGNLGSLLRAYEDIGATASLIDAPKHASQCRRLVLPGVGAFTDCMVLLDQTGWAGALKQAVSESTPLLGICVGMQLLADEGEEGADPGSATPGLGLIPGRVAHLRGLGCTDRLPHVGWNSLTATARGDRLLTGIPDGTDFYFVHSYAFVPRIEEMVLATATYCVGFVAAVGNGQVWGTQFHPEKSSKAGMRVLRNFLELGTC